MTQLSASTGSVLLFVYGTLKRGHCRARMLDGQRFIGGVQTKPIYRLVNCGKYPGLIRADTADGRAIEGELGLPIVGSDTALYWSIAKALGIKLEKGVLGRLSDRLD